MNILPDKPSELLRLAVTDCQKLEGRSDHQFDMDLWLEKEDNGICNSCMAGAVMLCSLDIKPKLVTKTGFCALANFISPSSDIFSKIECINLLRVGAIEGAIRVVGLHVDADHEKLYEKCRELIHNDGNSYVLRRASWDTYLKVADLLSAEGY